MQRRLGSTAETPGLSGSSYVESLKIKIQTLETQLWEERLQDTTPSRRAYNSPRDQDDTQQRTNVPGSSDVVDHPNGDLHDTIEEASYLSLAAMGAQRADHQPFPTQGLSFLTLLYAATGVSGTNPSTSQGNHAAHSAILAGLRNNVVVPHYEQSRTVNSAALDKYIEFVQQSYPFIASGGLRDVFKIALQTQQDDRDATTGNTAVDAEQPETTVIMLFGLATGLLVSPGYAYTEVIATNDNDVLVSSPTSTEISNDNRRLRCLVEHAQLPRSNRSEPTTDPWVQYINLRHWYDIMDTPAAPSLSHLQMLVHGLIEIVNRISFQNSQNWNLILCGAEPDIENYLNLLETQLLEQRCAPAAFDAFDVFAAGVMIMQLRMVHEPDVNLAEQITARIAARKSLVSQAINVLTMLSMRYPPIRSLRDVLSEYRAISIDNQQHLSLSHLRDLIDRSEICIPRPLQDMILRGFTP
ncbi:hypothetical protein PSV08DRAFT_351488 [Bipolaris maydis]|uniref:uncharacterized protein n=1 Tax=Cochliobolus heterostrophus TaxID=5016 RepID=UPI0024D3FC05|nr:hypothetical protein PSV08DRAFT_351488 [Bipolaris maydis]